MPKTCIIVAVKRAENYLVSHYVSLGYRIILISDKEHQKIIDPQIVQTFSKTYFLDSLTVESIIDLIKKEQFTLSNLTLFTDDEMLLEKIATVREKLKIPGYYVNDYQPFRNKILMKDYLAKHDFRVPYYEQLSKKQIMELQWSELQNKFGSSFIIKPIEGTGTHGVQLIKNNPDLQDWITKSNDNSNYDVEAYIDGDLYIAESFVYNNKIIGTHIFKYAFPCLDVQSGRKPLGVMRIREDSKEYNEIVRIHNRLGEQLKLLDGGVHTEYFINKAGQVIFLEFAARPGGAWTAANMKKNFNFNPYEQHLRLHLGLPIQKPIPQDVYYAEIFWPQLTNVYDHLIKQPITINSEYTITYPILVEDKARSSQFGSTVGKVAATIQFWNIDYQQFVADFESLKNFQPIVYQKKN